MLRLSNAAGGRGLERLDLASGCERLHDELDPVTTPGCEGLLGISEWRKEDVANPLSSGGFGVGRVVSAYRPAVKTPPLMRSGQVVT